MRFGETRGGVFVVDCGWFTPPRPIAEHVARCGREAGDLAEDMATLDLAVCCGCWSSARFALGLVVVTGGTHEDSRAWLRSLH